VSRRRTDLENTLTALVEATDELRVVLLRYKRANLKLISMVAEGESVLGALERVGGSRLRPGLTDALDTFSGARHDGRLALVAAALEDGDTMSDIGRALSVSRQLISRLAGEEFRCPALR
jgi:hypothetical protein